MKVTLELLRKYGISPKDEDYFIREGLEGGDLMEIIDREDISIEFLYFIRKYLNLTIDEAAAINAKCNIDDESQNVWNSEFIERSSNIMESIEVRDSSNIRFSKQVARSKYVFDSRSVNRSSNIVKSEDVSDSDRVIKSENVSASEQVLNSKNIKWCDNVFNSLELEDCGFIYQSEGLNRSYFCGFMKNSSHCLFCSGLEGKEYYIFNEEVTQEEFERVLEELQERLNAEDPLMIRVEEEEVFPENRYLYLSRFDSVFGGLSKELYGWIGTLPNYTDEKFVDLFFQDN